MLKNYIKIAFKVLLRRKFYTFISLFAISFTLMVLMVATSFFDHTFGVFPPETRLDRTLGVFTIRMEGEYGGDRSSASGPPGYRFLHRYVRTLSATERVSIFNAGENVASYINGTKIESQLKRTDGEFWKIMDFDFLEGGPFTIEDEMNGNYVAVINEATRQNFFGDERAVGKTIHAGGQTFRVVGVVANVPFFRWKPFSDIWVPISTAKTNLYKEHMMGNFIAIMLGKDKDALKKIREEFRFKVSQFEFPDPQYDTIYALAETEFENMARVIFSDGASYEDYSNTLLGIILGVMISFMILPTINLTNINVSRIMERASEIGVRKAFGASTHTLVGQFVVENVIITLLGGAIGFVLSQITLEFISAIDLVPYAKFQINYRIFLYGLAITIFFGVFSGVYPAWKMSRLHPVEALRGRS